MEAFRKYIENGLFLIPKDDVEEVYRPDEMLESVCERDEAVRAVRDFLKLPKMGVTGSRLIGLSRPDSDVDFVAYGSYSFNLGRKRIKDGIHSGEILPPDFRRLYIRRRVTIPYRAFLEHEKRKYNRGKILSTEFDLLYVRENKDVGIPENIGRKIGRAVVRGCLKDDKHVFDFPAHYPLDSDYVEAVLSFVHTYTGQAFKGEEVEAYGVLEEIDGRLYLIVGTRRECEEYLVSLTLLEEKGLLREFELWKSSRGVRKVWMQQDVIEDV